MTFKELTEKFPEIPSSEIKDLIDSLIQYNLIEKTFVDGVESYEVTVSGSEVSKLIPEVKTDLLFTTKKQTSLLN